MSARPTIIVWTLAVIAAIAAYVGWRQDRQNTATETESRTLFADRPIDADSVDRITIVRESGETFAFERAARGWRQVEPIEHPVDPFSINQLVVLANDLQSFEVVDDAEQDRDIGLAPPLGTMTFETGERTVELQLGARGIGGRAYVRVGQDGPVQVVNHDLHQRALQHDTREWRLRNIFDHAGQGSVRVETSQPDWSMVLERDRRRWNMTTPWETRTSEQDVTALLSALERVQLNGFIEDAPNDLARYGLDAAQASVQVTTETIVDSEPSIVTETLHIGGTTGPGADDRYAMIDDRDVVFTLSAEALRELLSNPARFVARTGTGVNPPDVSAIRIAGPGGEFRIERQIEAAEQAWVAPVYDNQVVMESAVNELLAHVTELVATSFRFDEYPYDDEVAVITFFGVGGRAIDALRIARWTARNDDWLLNNGDGFQRVYPGSTHIPLTPEAFGLE